MRAQSLNNGVQTHRESVAICDHEPATNPLGSNQLVITAPLLIRSHDSELEHDRGTPA